MIECRLCQYLRVLLLASLFKTTIHTFKWLRYDSNWKFCEFFLLIYADDTVVLSETAEDMQNALDAMNEYCNAYGLKINTDKTKVVVFFQR